MVLEAEWLLPMVVGHDGIMWGGGNVLCLVWGWLLHGLMHVLKVLILLKSESFTIFKFYFCVFYEKKRHIGTITMKTYFAHMELLSESFLYIDSSSKWLCNRYFQGKGHGG